MSIRNLLQTFLDGYPRARVGEPFKDHPLHKIMKDLVQKIEDLSCVRNYSPSLKVSGSVGQGNWATVPWIGLLDTRVAPSIQQGVYVVFLFAADMTRVYLTLNQGVTVLYQKRGAKEAKQELRKLANSLREREYIRTLPGFRLDWEIDLRTESGIGATYTDSTIAYKTYFRDTLPDDEELERDLEALLKAYKRYADGHNEPSPEPPPPEPGNEKKTNNDLPSFANIITELRKRVRAKGFFYPEDQFQAFCISLKTKPFVLLAGISGTGKTRLVELVARQFGVEERTIPVRPDWSDSSDLLGYRDLRGSFRPGPLLEVLREANENLHIPYFVCLDEMNLARVEHYFAEFLSIFEKRTKRAGRIVTPPIVGRFAGESPWSEVYLSDNVFLVGTVNMDETTHPFSRKVLDRANVHEFNQVELDYRPDFTPLGDSGALDWTSLRPVYCRLPEFYHEDPEMFDRAISIIKEINAILEPGLFQVGYRVRDEICLFLLHAKEAKLKEQVALDMQILSKILPRVQGSSATTRDILVRLWNWVTGLSISADDPDLLDKTADVPEGARFPKTAAKIRVMLCRLEEDGYTSFWV